MSSRSGLTLALHLQKKLYFWWCKWEYKTIFSAQGSQAAYLVCLRSTHVCGSSVIWLYGWPLNCMIWVLQLSWHNCANKATIRKRSCFKQLSTYSTSEVSNVILSSYCEFWVSLDTLNNVGVPLDFAKEARLFATTDVVYRLNVRQKVFVCWGKIVL